MVLAFLSVSLLLSVIGTATAAPKKPIYHFPTDKSEAIAESVIKCINKLGLDPSIIDLVKEGRFSANAKTVDVLVCMDKDLGYGRDDGRINVDKVMNDLFLNKPEIRAPMEACDKEYSNDPEVNLMELLLCLKENLPVKVML